MLGFIRPQGGLFSGCEVTLVAFIVLGGTGRHKVTNGV